MNLKKTMTKASLLAAIFASAAMPAVAQQVVQQPVTAQPVKTQVLKTQPLANQTNHDPAPVAPAPLPAPVQNVTPAPVPEKSGHGLKHFFEAVAVLGLLGGGAFWFMRRKSSGLPEGMKPTGDFSWKPPVQPEQPAPVTPAPVATAPVTAAPAAPSLQEMQAKTAALQNAIKETADTATTPTPAAAEPEIKTGPSDDTAPKKNPAKFDI